MSYVPHLRILHVLPSLKQSYGGPIRAVLDLSARAEQNGLFSEVLGFGELAVSDNPFRRELIHTLPIAWPRRYCYSPMLRQWLRKNLCRFDGVVLHGMWLYPNRSVAEECLRAGVPYACFPHGMLEPWAVYRQSLWKTFKKVIYWYLRERAIFKRARCVFFTLERERKLADETFHLGGLQRILIPYGAEMLSERAPEPLNPNLLQRPGTRVALFLGRLHPKKNIQFLIDAWREAAPAAEWHLMIAGSGDEQYTQRLRAAIALGGLEKNVHLAGFVTGQDKAYLLQSASWFLLPSLQENFGIAVVEAISCGCPVVVSDQVFFADNLHAKSEVLPLQRDAWVKFIRERMVDDEWRAEIAALEQSHVAETMGLEKVSRAWAATLAETFRPGASV